MENSDIFTEYDSIKANGSETIPDDFVIGPGECGVVCVLIELEDDTLDAEYTSTVEDGLHFTLNAV